MNVVATDGAPKAIGPYCQAITHAGLIYCSGQIPLDPATMKVVEGGIEAQTEQVLKNLSAVLQAAGSDPSKVLKTIVFLSNLEDFPKMNAVYERAFGGHCNFRHAERRQGGAHCDPQLRQSVALKPVATLERPDRL
jgi:reactive intermediate/imine deaminase